MMLTTLCSFNGPKAPEPDATITELENRWIAKHGIQAKAGGSQLESKMASLTIGDAFFPSRPAFGTGGGSVILWANYFKIDSTVSALYRYDLRITEKRTTQAEENAATEKPKGKAKGKDTSAGQATGAKEPKGKKLAKLIELTLKKLGNAVLATEYKQQLISLKKLQLPPDGIMEIQLIEPGRRPETWFVRFDGPSSLDISSLMGYLQTLEDPANDGVFPKYPAEIDALGVVLGHTARSNPNTVAVGRNRFFGIDPQRKEEARPMPNESFLEILRGYVQSVRPATGRLLLNANVTHGVFRQGYDLDRLLGRYGPYNFSAKEMDRRSLGSIQRIHRFLAKSRIVCKVPGDKPGQFIETERTMAGLATSRDGGSEEHSPQFKPGFFFPSPTTVRFYLRQPKNSDAVPPPGLQFNTYVLVEDYYKKSKYTFSSFLAQHSY
jgi:hypothetical protein